MFSECSDAGAPPALRSIVKLWFAGELGQREGFDDADRFYARQAAQPLHEGVVKGRPRPSVELRLLRRHLERENVLRHVAGVDVAKLREAAQQQPGADHQQQRERRLRDDESVARPVTATSRAASAVAQPGQLRLRPLAPRA